MRLDVALTTRGLVASRTEAQNLIKSSQVQVDGKIVVKSSFDVSEDANIAIIGETCPYVSRGGYKLQAALEAFKVVPENRVCLDIGASTGGFTDCLLQHGASFVYAVENGHGQLHQSLSNHPNVCSLEHYNARELSKKDFPRPITLAVMDVSFISQTLILPALAQVLEPGAALITLIKPQFEVGRAHISKGGVVKDKAARKNAVDTVVAFAEQIGLSYKGIITSPILGGDGNEEYLAYFTA